MLPMEVLQLLLVQQPESFDLLQVTPHVGVEPIAKLGDLALKLFEAVALLPSRLDPGRHAVNHTPSSLPVQGHLVVDTPKTDVWGRQKIAQVKVASIPPPLRHPQCIRSLGSSSTLLNVQRTPPGVDPLNPR
nr:hypothetical protein [Deinococcus sp. Leaf326]